MSKPIWAVELSWGQECYHTHWVKYFDDHDKAKEEYRKVLLAELELRIDDDDTKLLKKLQKKSNEIIESKIQDLIQDIECDQNITLYFDLEIYNVLDRIE